MQDLGIISSDSDFTRLATRIRESGLTVYGFGEQKTPTPFVSACDKFIYTEILRPDAKMPSQELDVDFKQIVTTAIRAVSKDDSWAALSGVGGYINKNYPSFDPRNYGYEKLGKLIKSIDYIEIDERISSKNPNITHIYVRLCD
ncbi:MAG: NYN domain-containing protein [Ghiorsea sp.]|nr:NYN domain-containing protein [Ghiorsea sp.]